MKERVRAILLTAAGTTLVINRVRPGVPVYQVLVGGGVEPEDTCLEAALLREIHEEIAGQADDLRPFYEFKNDKGETEHFYTARIVTWNFDNRTGPEFQRQDRGKYQLQEVPLTVEAIDALNLMPPQAKQAILDAIRTGSLTAAAGIARAQGLDIPGGDRGSSAETSVVPVRTCVAIINRGEICLIHRYRTDGDQYSVPGGLLEGDEPVAAALARELKEELNLDVAALGVEPVLCWEQHQATTRSGAPFQRRHLIHVLQAPDNVRDVITATEQDAEDDTRVVWLPTSEAAALHLYPDIGAALGEFAGVPGDVSELPPMHDGTYAWR